MLGEPVAALGSVVDEIAFIHNMVGKTGVHSQGTLLQTTGFNRPGFPGMGCWVSYGLGSMNENLPTFVVLPDHRGLASNGTKNWDSAFLPAQHQGSAVYPGSKTPIADLYPSERATFINKQSERDALDLLNETESHATPTSGPATVGSTRGFRATNWRPRCSLRRRKRSTSPKSRSTS